MQIAICDDEILFQKQLERCIREQFQDSDFAIDIFDSGDKLLESMVVKNREYNIIFLDIEMQGSSGMDVARKLQEMKVDSYLVFVTSHQEYVYQGYEVEAFRYLLKPINKIQVVAVIGQVLDRRSEEQYITLHHSAKDILVRVKDILYLEAEGVYVKVVMKNETYQVRIALQRLQEQLPKECFLHVHRSYIMNCAHVKEVMNNDFMLDNEDIIPIGRGRKKQVKDLFYEYISRRGR